MNKYAVEGVVGVGQGVGVVGEVVLQQRAQPFLSQQRLPQGIGVVAHVDGPNGEALQHEVVLVWLELAAVNAGTNGAVSLTVTVMMVRRLTMCV